MKILNLYCGIGGNRKLWGDEHEITAVENNPKIAKIYQDFFPNDKVIVVDAHQFLLEHYKEFDFIWSSPPCPTHSRIRKLFHNQNPPIFPDMKLYEEIIFLQAYFKGEWVVENVISFYEPLIKPFECGKHYYWSSFIINNVKIKSRKHFGTIEKLQKLKGFNLDGYEGIEKIKTLRNCVEPEIALQIFNMAFKNKQQKL
ncbi:MAG: DNA cytosine methyltransferase [Candidatus Aenigmarchaeota archaeon]|nr:DNA cytosine methyltransferase [Candidatus Aenigmarchaeota archaeon]